MVRTCEVVRIGISRVLQSILPIFHSAHEPEEGAHLVHEARRLLERSEVRANAGRIGHRLWPMRQQ